MRLPPLWPVLVVVLVSHLPSNSESSPVLKNVLIALLTVHPSCANLTISPLGPDVLRVDVVTGCFVEINGTEVTTIHSGTVQALMTAGVVLSHNKTEHHLLYDMNTHAVVTINITCYIPCANISLPLGSPVAPANGHLVYSSSEGQDGAHVTIAEVVCDHGYYLVGNQIQGVFRPVHGVWYWTNTLSDASCVDTESPKDDSKDHTPMFTVVVLSALVILLVVVGIIFLVVAITFVRRRRMRTTGLVTNPGSSFSSSHQTCSSDPEDSDASPPSIPMGTVQESTSEVAAIQEGSREQPRPSLARQVDDPTSSPDKQKQDYQHLTSDTDAPHHHPLPTEDVEDPSVVVYAVGGVKGVITKTSP